VSTTNIGKRIRTLRTEKQISQEALGNIVTVDKTTISGYETGRITPPLDIIVKMADYFGVSTDYLLGVTTCHVPISILTEKAWGNYTIGRFLEKYMSLDPNIKEAITTIVMETKK